MNNDNKNIEMRKNDAYNFIFLKNIIQARDFQIFTLPQTPSKVAKACIDTPLMRKFVTRTKHT